MGARGYDNDDDENDDMNDTRRTVNFERASEREHIRAQPPDTKCLTMHYVWHILERVSCVRVFFGRDSCDVCGTLHNVHATAAHPTST